MNRSWARPAGAVAACIIAGTVLVGERAPVSSTPVTTPVPVTVSVEAGPHSVLTALVTVSSDRPIQPALVARSAHHIVTIPAPARAAATLQIALVGLRAKATYDLALSQPGMAFEPSGDLTYASGPLPDGMPDLIVAATPRARPGYTLFNLYPDGGDPRRRAYVVMVDETGAVVWYLETPGSDVRQLPNGLIQFQYDHVGARQVDLLGNVVHEWTTSARLQYGQSDAPLTAHPAVIDLPRLHHEISNGPDGSLIALSFEVRPVTGIPADRCLGEDPANYKGDLLVQVGPNGRVLRRFSIFDIVDPVARPGSEPCEVHGDPYVPGVRYIDWTHGNAVTLYEDQNLLLYSSRYLDAIMAIRWQDDEQGPAGELLWELGPDGDFELTSGLWFSHQHAPELLDDHTILLYDNGNLRAGSVAVGGRLAPYSRAVMYEFDHSSPDRSEWTARQIWQHVDEEGGVPVYSDMIGDADDIGGGHVLVTNGAVISTEHVDLHGNVSETDRDTGEVVLDIRTVPYGGSWSTFRAEHLDSLYPGARR